MGAAAQFSLTLHAFNFLISGSSNALAGRVNVLAACPSKDTDGEADRTGRNVTECPPPFIHLSPPPALSTPQRLWPCVTASEVSMENGYRDVADRLFAPVILSVLLVAFSGESRARDKTDLVFLKNGDRITGEVKSLERGRLEISTDGMGTLRIEWDDVERLESQYQFEFEASGGEILTGTIVHSEAENIRLQGRNRTVDLDPYSLVRISPVEARVSERFNGSVELGFDFTRANRRKRWVAEAGLSYRVPQYLARATVSSLVTDQDEGEPANRQVLDLDWIYNLGGRWYAGGLFQATHNDLLDLDVRTTLGGTLGRRILQTNEAILFVFAGAQCVTLLRRE